MAGYLCYLTRNMNFHINEKNKTHPFVLFMQHANEVYITLIINTTDKYEICNSRR